MVMSESVEISIDTLQKLNYKKMDNIIINYLDSKLSNIHINLRDRYKGSPLKLMRKNLLLGWCWESTETSAVFLEDSDYIERGNLHFNDTTYYHSWISFKYDDEYYIFDPGLSIVSKKKDYYDLYKPDVFIKIAKQDVLTEMISKYISMKNENSQLDEYEFGLSNDLSSAIYRNGAKYNIEIENNKVKKLRVHYVD